MTSVSVQISIDANGELWSMNGQFDVKKTVIIGRSGLPGKVKFEEREFWVGIKNILS